jgi:MFS family permease
MIVNTKMARALRSSTFRKIAAGQLVSQLGDWLDYVAVLSLVAFTWHQGAAGLAAVVICAGVPVLVVSPFSGVWADRLPHRPVLVACDLARAATVLCYLLATHIAVLLPLIFVKGSFSTLFSPAESSATRHAVPEEDLHSAITIETFIGQLTKIVGPGMGGVIVATAGIHGAFIADAASFLVSAVILSTVRVERHRGESMTGMSRATGTVRGDLVAGLRFVLATRVLLTAIVAVSVTMFLAFLFDTLTPLAVTALGFRPDLLGAWLSSFAVGAVAGTVLTGRWGERLRPLSLMGLSQVAAGIGVALTGLIIALAIRPPAVVMLAVVACIGIAASGLLVAFPLIVRSSTPPEFAGRVAAVSAMLPSGLQMAAPVIGATLAIAFGIGPVFAIAGLSISVVGVAVATLHISEKHAMVGADTETPDFVAHSDDSAACRAPAAARPALLDGLYLKL